MMRFAWADPTICAIANQKQNAEHAKAAEKIVRGVLGGLGVPVKPTV
jgi:hypothetical protein